MGAERGVEEEGGGEFYINAIGIKIDNLISNVLFHARFHLSRDIQIIKDNCRITVHNYTACLNLSFSSYQLMGCNIDKEEYRQ